MRYCVQVWPADTALGSTNNVVGPVFGGVIICVCQDRQLTVCTRGTYRSKLTSSPLVFLFNIQDKVETQERQ